MLLVVATAAAALGGIGYVVYEAKSKPKPKPKKKKKKEEDNKKSGDDDKKGGEDDAEGIVFPPDPDGISNPCLSFAKKFFGEWTAASGTAPSVYVESVSENCGDPWDGNDRGQHISMRRALFGWMQDLAGLNDTPQLSDYLAQHTYDAVLYPSDSSGIPDACLALAKEAFANWFELDTTPEVYYEYVFETCGDPWEGDNAGAYSQMRHALIGWMAEVGELNNVTALSDQVASLA